MPTFKELRNKYSIPRCDDVKLGWWGRNITSPVGLLFAKLFLKTPISANHISFLWLVIGFVGCVLFTFGSYLYSILACVLFQIVFSLDTADGVVARYKKQSSIKGEYMETICHTFVHDIFLFVGISIGAYRLTDNYIILVLGLLIPACNLMLKFISIEKVHLFVRSKQYLNVFEKKSSPKPTKPSRLKGIYDFVIMFFRGYSPANFALLMSVFNRLDLYIIFYGLAFPIIVLVMSVYEVKRGFGWVGGFFSDK